jgi:hypothetical protein
LSATTKLSLPPLTIRAAVAVGGRHGVRETEIRAQWTSWVSDISLLVPDGEMLDSGRGE